MDSKTIFQTFLIPIILTILTNLLLWIRESRKTSKEKKLENDKKRFELLYAPMKALLINILIDRYSSVLAPYFKNRLRNSINYLKDCKFRRAIIALFDKRKTRESAEVVQGLFPYSEIKKILNTNIAYADDQLIEIVGRIDRTRHDRLYDNIHEDSNSMITGEVELYDHISNMYSKLKSKLSL